MESENGQMGILNLWEIQSLYFPDLKGKDTKIDLYFKFLPILQKYFT